MQLAETYALGFTAPLIMTVLAVPMLGERIRWRRVLSTLVGFARRAGDGAARGGRGRIPLTPTVVWLMAGIVAMAITRIMARQLSRTETPECQAFWLMVSHGLAGVGMLLVTPRRLTASSVWGALLFLGVSSGLAHCVFTRAYGLAPVSALAPYEYTMLLWGGLLGFAGVRGGAVLDHAGGCRDRRVGGTVQPASRARAPRPGGGAVEGSRRRSGSGGSDPGGLGLPPRSQGRSNPRATSAGVAASPRRNASNALAAAGNRAAAGTPAA